MHPFSPSFEFIDENGEEYMVLAEVVRHYGRSSTQIFMEYPGLYRRQATAAERAVLYR